MSNIQGVVQSASSYASSAISKISKVSVDIATKVKNFVLSAFNYLAKMLRVGYDYLVKFLKSAVDLTVTVGKNAGTYLSKGWHYTADKAVTFGKLAKEKTVALSAFLLKQANVAAAYVKSFISTNPQLFYGLGIGTLVFGTAAIIFFATRNIENIA